MIVRLLVAIYSFIGVAQLIADELPWSHPGAKDKSISPWIFARPLERSLRIGLIAPAGAQQEAQLLKQRFDCEIVPLSLGQGNPTSLSAENRHLLAEKIRQGKFDVLVLARIEWDVLGAELSAQIVKTAQQDGLGIVFLSSPKPPATAGDPLKPVLLPREEFTGLALAKLPGFGFAPNDESFFTNCLKGFSVGRGRLLVAYYGMKESTRHHHLVPDAGQWKKGFNHYDLQLAFVGKAIRWAAQTAPAVLLENVDCTASVKCGENPKLTCGIRNGFGQRLQIEVRVRRFTPSSYDPQPILVEKEVTGQPLSFTLSAAIPAGDYAALIRLSSKGKTLDWACARFSVESKARIRNMEIHKLALPENSSIVPIGVNLDNPPPEGARLRAESRDAYDRLLGTIEIPCKKRYSVLKAPCARSQSAHNRATVTLLNAAGMALEQQTIVFRIHRQYPRQELYFYSKSPGDSDLAAHLFCQKMSSWNVDALRVDFPGKNRDLTATEKLAISWRLDEIGMFNLSSLPCFTLPAAGGKSTGALPVKERIRQGKAKAEVIHRHSPMAVSLGALPVMGIDATIDTETVELYKEMVRSLSPLLPCVPVGIEGFRAFSSPAALFDLPLLQLPFSDPLQLELVRSFSQGADNSRICCFNTDRRHPALSVYQHWFPWTVLFHGMNGVCFDSEGMGNAATIDSLYFWESAAETMAHAKAGIDRLLLSGKADDCRIAVLYSPRSIACKRAPHYGNSQRATLAMTRLLEDCGYQYRLLDENLLDKEKNLHKQCAVLVLPSSLCLSNSAVDNIKNFVKKGGALVADWGIGLYDEQETKRPESPFQQTFGIRFAQTYQPVAKTENRQPDFFATAFFENGTKLKEGMAKGFLNGFPLFITRLPAGSDEKKKGGAAFFNFSVEDYLQARGPRGARLRQWLQDFISASSKARPPVHLRGQWNRHPEQVEAFRWERDEEIYIAVLKEPETKAEGEDITLRLDEEKYVYDTFTGKYRGKTDEVKFHLAPGESRLFALLPYHVTSLNATRLVGEKYPNPAFHLSTSGHDGGRKSTRIYHIEVLDPDGELYPAANGDHSASRGKLDFDVPLGLDPKPGRWLFKATDAATGFSAEKEFFVKRKKK